MSSQEGPTTRVRVLAAVVLFAVLGGAFAAGMLVADDDVEGTRETAVQAAAPIIELTPADIGSEDDLFAEDEPSPADPRPPAAEVDNDRPPQCAFEPVVDAGCEGLCAALVACGGDDTCLVHCAMNIRAMRPQAARAWLDCTRSSAHLCTGDAHRECLRNAVETAPVIKGARWSEACAALEKRAKKCGFVDPAVDECLQWESLLRPEVADELIKCGQVGCGELSECLERSSCDLFFEATQPVE